MRSCYITFFLTGCRGCIPITTGYSFSGANDLTSKIKELSSNYQLKSGTRSGADTADKDSPSGTYGQVRLKRVHRKN